MWARRLAACLSHWHQLVVEEITILDFLASDACRHPSVCGDVWRVSYIMQTSNRSAITIRCKVGLGWFSQAGNDYLATHDHHCGFFELDYLPGATSETVVGKLKNNFCRHCIPHTLVNENGPQFSPAQSSKCVRKWQFVHDTSSPRHSQADGALK